MRYRPHHWTFRAASQPTAVTRNDRCTDAALRASRPQAVPHLRQPLGP